MFFSVKSGWHPLNSSFRGAQGSAHLVANVGMSSGGPRSELHPSAGFAADSAVPFFDISNFFLHEGHFILN